MEFFIVLIAAIYFIVKLITGIRDEAYAKKTVAGIRQTMRTFTNTVLNSNLESKTVQRVMQSIMTAKRIPEIEEVCKEIDIPYPNNKEQATKILMGLKGFATGTCISSKITYWWPNASPNLKSWDPNLDFIETKRVQKKFFIWLSKQLRERGVPYKIYAIVNYRPNGSETKQEAYISVDNPAQLSRFYTWDVYIEHPERILSSIDQNCTECDPDYKE